MGFVWPFLSALLATSLITASDSIKTQPFSFESAEAFGSDSPLEQIFSERQINTIAEIGSLCAKATEFFSCRIGVDGRVFAIDRWLGTPDLRGEKNGKKIACAYTQFLKDLESSKFGSKIIPLRMTPDIAEKALGNYQMDMVYIAPVLDSEQIFHNIINWHTHVAPGGILCGGEWREAPIRAGVERAASQLKLQVEADEEGLFWVMK